MFGELSFFDPGPRSATATRSRTSSSVRSATTCSARWSRTTPGSRWRSCTSSPSACAARNEVVGDLVFSDVPGRVAKALIDLAERFGRQADDGIHVSHDLTQEELAQLVGASREGRR